MARTRALLTDRDRELIADEDAGNRRHQVISEVRGRIYEELPTDISLLEEHHPVLLDELREVVCRTPGKEIRQPLREVFDTDDTRTVQLRLEDERMITLVVRGSSTDGNGLCVDGYGIGEMRGYYRLKDNGPNTPVVLHELTSGNDERREGVVRAAYWIEDR